MKINYIDKKKLHEISFIGEYTRLVEEIKPRKASFFINSLGNRIDIPERKGIDIEKCEFMDIVNWLADTRIKKSNTSICFAHRMMAVRFSNDYATHRNKINNRFKLEYEMIQSNSKNDPSWLGEVGFSNMIRLDKSLTNPLTKTMKLKNDIIQVIKK
tara:strand:- start:110 stop:580 length:471 start_codon:yes stop_codon:yes gene_type:complete